MLIKIHMFFSSLVAVGLLSMSSGQSIDQMIAGVSSPSADNQSSGNYMAYKRVQCIDVNKRSCPYWAKDPADYCTTNAWVKAFCKKSCGTCDDTGVSPPSADKQSSGNYMGYKRVQCIDVNKRSCPYWAKDPADYCTTNAWVKAFCKKSCSTCDDTGVSPPSADKQSSGNYMAYKRVQCIDVNKRSCPYWAKDPADYCITNAWVKAFCKKSCGTCDDTGVSPPSADKQSSGNYMGYKRVQCIDVNKRSCPYWSKDPADYCATNAWVKAFCKKSCGTCDDADV